jgi:hypothetical protein
MVAQFTMQECQENCEECYRLCQQTVVYAMQQRDRPVHESHMRLLLDCVDICRACANLLLRGSELYKYVCRCCATICERCAEFCGECRDDAQMRLCEQVCLRCSEGCAQLAA